MVEANAKTPIMVIKLGEENPPSATDGGASPTKSVATMAMIGGMNSSTMAKSHMTTTIPKMAANRALCVVNPPDTHPK